MPWILSAFADEGGDPIDTQVENLRLAGYTHVDLRGVNGHNISALPVDIAENTARALVAANVKVCMFGSPIGKIDIGDDFAVDQGRLEHLAKMRDVFGCDQVRIFSYYNKSKQPLAAWQEESLRRLEALKEQAVRLGLRLFHENERHIFGDRCPQVQTIADRLRDGDVFSLIFDFDNYNQSGDDVWDNWRKLAGQTDAFHLKDSDAQGHHVPLGEGAGRVREILSDALKRGWEGPVILEPHLTHSSAVLATGVGGKANQKLKDLPPGETFQIGARAAKKLLAAIGAKVV